MKRPRLYARVGRDLAGLLRDVLALWETCPGEHRAAQVWAIHFHAAVLAPERDQDAPLVVSQSPLIAQGDQEVCAPNHSATA